MHLFGCTYAFIARGCIAQAAQDQLLQRFMLHLVELLEAKCIEFEL